MRRLLVASLVAAGLAGAFAHPGAADSTQLRRRKTLGFGPVHDHAVYNTEPLYSIQGFTSTHTDPFDVATEFISSLNLDAVGGASTFRIRQDSYTDKNTGITHVYARQYINGVEVADGDINVNVKDGVILSYGDSFYRGDDVSGFGSSTPVDPHSEYCQALTAELTRRAEARSNLYNSGEQVVLGSEHAVSQEDFAPGNLPELHEWNCAHVDTPFKMAAGGKFSENDDQMYSEQALLQFMIAATPDNTLAQAMVENPTEYLEKMRVTPVHHFAGDHAAPSLVIDDVPDAVAPVKARMAFVQVPSGDSVSLQPVWKFEVEMQDNWYEASVSMMPPHRIISVVDWASDSPLPMAPIPKEPSSKPVATYNVFKWGVNDPTDGNRTLEKENFDALASPAGWHSLPYDNDPASSHLNLKKGGAVKFRNTTDTWGNNVFAHENWEGRNAWITNYRPDAGEKLVFDWKYDPKETNRTEAMDEAKAYINATVTQLFYTGNMIHDLYYRYGFDEVAGNFQQHNFGRGGEEDDAVIMNAQDGSGFNNANFMTPPDGQNGRCRMYLWNTANPYRDGDLEAGIVIHEYSHGLSTRLTGGPANSGCLGWGESGGMGEGWGDFLATTIRSTKNYSDYAMGAWAANRDNGIRNFPYSLNDTINPSTYKTLDKPGYWGVHAIGEVWAEILWVVSQNLIAKHGFSDSLYPPPPSTDGTIPTNTDSDFYRPQAYDASGAKKPLVPKHGNALSVQLVLNGMKLQPCRPSFFDARDAILAADQALTGGENFCELWDGFAKRGLGPNARVEGRTPWGGGIRTDDFKTHAKCDTAPIPEPEPEPTPEPGPGDGDDDDDDDGGDDDDFPWPWVHLEVNAHGYVEEVTIDGKAYKGNPIGLDGAPSFASPIRRVNDNGPIATVNDPQLSCGQSDKASVVADANPGSVVEFQWTSGWPHVLGPIITYLAECVDTTCDQFDSRNGSWIKIHRLGRKADNTTWYQADVAANKPISVTLPTNIKPGQYLIRHEIIALHNVVDDGTGAEFFPSCTQLRIGGSAQGGPSSVDEVMFPGGYNASNKGLSTPTSELDTLNPYLFPGPRIAVLSNDDGSASSTSDMPNAHPTSSIPDTTPSEFPSSSTSASSSSPTAVDTPIVGPGPDPPTFTQSSAQFSSTSNAVGRRSSTNERRSPGVSAVRRALRHSVSFRRGRH
ncbi:Fungalysin/Thermolysin Extracellular metalloproteinase 5 [Steccherinum ochraceum]|uniref:AA9 family lytic polysaccharide monooxygenase n=1 Tax=Steccherinum ochraceum TaxID=92696 RepID=A0A4R0RV76_9APHY|nr:Fungalysin/Thermolysin Extracellular metalloproteinase 5 [Steccherinum ochraceum]